MMLTAWLKKGCFVLSYFSFCPNVKEPWVFFYLHKCFVNVTTDDDLNRNHGNCVQTNIFCLSLQYYHDFCSNVISDSKIIYKTFMKVKIFTNVLSKMHKPIIKLFLNNNVIISTTIFTSC